MTTFIRNTLRILCVLVATWGTTAQAQVSQLPPLRVQPVPVIPFDPERILKEASFVPPAPFVRPSFEKPGFDRTRFPLERSILAEMQECCRKRGKSEFPRLGDEYEVLRPSTGHVRDAKPGQIVYNCIAWTVGVTDRWVWPGDKIEDFDRLYKENGYMPLRDLDYSVVPNAEKVVIYAVPGSTRSVVTHGAKQEKDGTWTSKLGGLALIKHRTPEAVGGGSYGSPVQVYIRFSRSAGSSSGVVGR